MSDLEKFLHDEKHPLPVLIKAALAHVQFETIHPFLDGNGRLGRLLTTLLLCSEKTLKEPLLYLSLYFKSNRTRYYELLQHVRVSGDWESWLGFFLDAVLHTAGQAVDTTQRLLALAEADRKKIQGLKRVTGSVLQVHQALVRKPLITISGLCELTGLYPVTVNTCLKTLENMGMVKELTGKKRYRHYSYERYIRILNEGLELP